MFEEERELTVMLLVDVSGSLEFGTVKQMKKDMVISSETMGHVNIYNVNGTQLQSFAVTTGNAVKSHLLASGVYVVNVQTKGRADYTTKVYVE